MKHIFRLLSYLAAFIYGCYACDSLNGNRIELYRWVLTGMFGIMFYLMSLKDAK